jgi:cold shock CspA family protein
MTTSIGIVKWFGGFNKLKNKENNFGFVEDVAGFDVFIHEKALQKCRVPLEGDMVIYELEKSGEKWKASNAYVLVTRVPSLSQLFELHKLCEDNSGFYRKFLEVVGNIQEDSFTGYSDEELTHYIEKLGVSALVSSLFQIRNCWAINLKRLADLKLVDPLFDIPLSMYPQSSYRSWSKDAISKNESEIAERLPLIDKEKAQNFVTTNYEELTNPLKMLASFTGLITDEKQLKSVVDDVSRYLKSLHHEDEKFPEYLQNYIDEHIEPKGGLINDPVFGGELELIKFHKYLYEKDLAFVTLYENSDYLQTRFDAFVLKEIFTLVMAGNSLDQVYNLFLNRLWAGITSGQLNPVTQLKQILKIFPSCGSIGKELSCEAVYWEKQRMFLCRGKPCRSPEVKGRAHLDYLRYSIYDWFVHYEINYLTENEPSRRDFPIKVASYINRLREIFDVIHCRVCESLMLPNMSYARVEHMVYEKGQMVKKDLAPAYRLTVFKCPDEQCIDSHNQHYINHCYGCGEIIDSRDCKMKCDAGLYICRSCASCCSNHAINNPVGQCPDCGSSLLLYQTPESRGKYGGFNRFVKCSSESCDFNIPTYKLDKRFYFVGCGPVHHINTTN